MWLSSFFSKTKKNECEDTIQQTINEDKLNEDKVNEDKQNEDKLHKDKVNEESIKILSKNEDEPIIKADLQERVEHVKIVHENLQALQNKDDLHLNNDTTNTKKNEQLKNCKLEEVVKIIPVLEQNIQTLTKKVSFLSGFINMKQLNAKIETDQNIILNNSNIVSPNSIKELSVIENTTTPKKKDIAEGKVSIKNKKTSKNNSIVIKNKNPGKPGKPGKSEKLEKNLTKTINENDQVTNFENSAQNNTKSIDQLSDYLDESLECFFTKIQSALSQFKIDKINEKCEIMVHLSDLDNKMNTNEVNIDKLTYSVQQLSKKNEQEIMKNQSNIKTENKQEMQKNIDDIKMCIDYLIQPNSIDVQQTQQFADTSIMNTNTKSGCTSDRCVCQIINNANAADIEIINSNDGHNQIKYGDLILCEFLKAKLTMEMLKRSEHQMAQFNEFSNLIDDNKTCNLSVCSKKSNHILNNRVENQIDDNKTCNLSVCSKKSSHILNNRVENQIDDNKTCNLSVCSKKSIHFLNNCAGNQIDDNLKNNCDQKRNEEKKMNHIIVCPKQSIHNFSKFAVKSDTDVNQPISKKSVHGKNQICEFLSSQPIPEWIRRNQNVLESDNPCNNPPTVCHLNSSKLYNIEQIVKDSRYKHNIDGIVYEITEKQDVSGEDKKCRTFKEHPLVPCNSLDPSNWNQ